jgi:hypothetical protein
MATEYSSDLPVIKQGGKYYNISQLINKSIYANQPTKIYSLPYSQDKINFVKDIDTILADDVYLFSKKLNNTVYNLDGSVSKKTTTDGEWLMKVIGFTSKGDYIIGINSSGKKVQISSNPNAGNWKALSKEQRSKIKKGQKYINLTDNYSFSYKGNNLIKTVNAGELLGILDTWVNGKYDTGDFNYIFPIHKSDPTSLFLVVKPSSTSSKKFYVELKKSTLNIPSLTEQGALTVEEEIEKEEEEDKSWMDKLSENLSDLGSVAKTVLIAGGIAFVVITLKNYSQNKK